MGWSYTEAAKALAEHFGLSYSSTPRKIFRKIPAPITKPVKVEGVDYSDFFAQAAANIDKTDY